MKCHELMIHGMDASDPGMRHVGEAREGHMLIPTVACPHCTAMPLRVVHFGQAVAHGHHAYVAAGCMSCDRHVGTARAVISLFGTKEDKAMFGGRLRIYGGGRQDEAGELAHQQHAKELELMRGKV